VQLSGENKMKIKLLLMIMALGVLIMSGCQQANNVVNSNTATNTNTTANSNTATNSNASANANATGNSNSNVIANSNSNKAEKPESDSNKVETTKKVEKTNPAIVTGEQVNGTWSKGESVIKIQALGDGKLKVFFNIFNERTLNQGSADGVANINGIDATFSPVVDGAQNKCKFTMKFTGGKLIVEQFGDPFDCGFGNGVSADGTYTKTSSAKPNFDNPM